jgi:hypothetical protein
VATQEIIVIVWGNDMARGKAAIGMMKPLEAELKFQPVVPGDMDVDLDMDERMRVEKGAMGANFNQAFAGRDQTKMRRFNQNRFPQQPDQPRIVQPSSPGFSQPKVPALPDGGIGKPRDGSCRKIPVQGIDNDGKRIAKGFLIDKIGE